MTIQEQIATYIESLPEARQKDVQILHTLMLETMPGCRLWFLDGKNSEGKVVSNPNIGYGFYTIRYADGSTREFYQVGLSGNKTGISVYIFGIEDKNFLNQMYGNRIGKATVSSYCIKFKSLKDLDRNVLEEAIRYGYEVSGQK